MLAGSTIMTSKSFDEATKGPHRHCGPLSRRLTADIFEMDDAGVYLPRKFRADRDSTDLLLLLCFALSLISLTKPHVVQAMEMAMLVDSLTNGDIVCSGANLALVVASSAEDIDILRETRSILGRSSTAFML
jgi:hypothetical protein